jgi:hypothetical protein
MAARRAKRQSGHEIAEFQTDHFGVRSRLGKQNEPTESFCRNFVQKGHNGGDRSFGLARRQP